MINNSSSKIEIQFFFLFFLGMTSLTSTKKNIIKYTYIKYTKLKKNKNKFIFSIRYLLIN
jgi:hypothetical protein